MFVEDLKEDFYNVLLGNRVLLLVHYDVDAICTCKILQGLFKCDNISYTLVPVGGISELKTAYEENNEEVKYVVMINCGGTIDLVQVLQPEDDVVFFVIDAHKPTDVCNVYSDSQVRLIHREDDENIPEFDDIFRDDDDAEEEEEIERGHEGLEALVEKRRARRAWEERRHTLLFNYTQFSYYGQPSACVAVQLSFRLSRVTLGGLWAGGVAVAASSALHQRPPARTLLDADEINRHVASATRTDDATAAKIVLEKDVWLPLYRSWCIESALKHAPTAAPHLKLHTLAGANKLRQLLADMGFPLQQARQSYRSMDVELRRCLLTSLETAATKHSLPALTHTTFILRLAHSPPVPAVDVVYAILALIEHETISKGEGFQHALSALDIAIGVNESRKLGMDTAKRKLEAIARVVNSTLSGKKMRLAGPFTYFIVPEGTPEATLIRGPHWLGVTARWAAGHAPSPMVCSAPYDAHARADAHTAILVGVPPRFAHEPRNLFGAAFEQAAARSGATVSLDFIDSSIITLPASQRTQFLDALTALLA